MKSFTTKTLHGLQNYATITENVVISALLLLLKVHIFWEGHKILQNLHLILMTVCTAVKSKVKISQNFVACSEYMNFTRVKILALQRKDWKVFQLFRLHFWSKARTWQISGTGFSSMNQPTNLPTLLLLLGSFYVS